MMNIENSNELRGAVELDSIDLLPSNDTINTGISFKDEFNKLLEEKDPATDPSLVDGIPIIAAITPDYTISYDTKTIDNVDAMFFLKVANEGESVNIKMNSDTSIIDASNYKTMEVSKTLGDMMVKASENNKALRLDFDEHVTVVLKISQEGKIDASFIPQNREVENYLKNNIDYLKVRFDEQSIAYSNISYKPYNRQKRQQGDNK